MSIRYWYQDRSQATVTTTSRWLRCTTLTRGSPSVRAMPETVRGWVLSLNSSTPASTASLGSAGSSSGSNGCGAVTVAGLALEPPLQPLLAALLQLHGQRRRTLAHPAARLGAVGAQLADLRVLGSDTVVADEPLAREERASAHVTMHLAAGPSDFDHVDTATPQAESQCTPAHSPDVRRLRELFPWHDRGKLHARCPWVRCPPEPRSVAPRCRLEGHGGVRT